MSKFSTKQAVRILSWILLTIAVVSIFGIVLISVYAKNNVDYEKDEILFRKATEDNMIRLFAEESNAATLYEEVCFSDNRKSWVDLEDISPFVIQAFLAAEDREFYHHAGINPKRTILAALNYLTKREAIFGASTITQQVIKNISGDDEVTIKRKLSEILRAFHIEKSHTKDEIFCVYLNIIPLSENVCGVGSGAMTYFDKDVLDLNASEAATLAAITNAPSKYNPYWHPEACVEKRNHVLYAMMDAGYLTKEEFDAYSQMPLGIVERKSQTETVYSWFSETVLSDVKNALIENGYTEKTAKQIISKGGLSIYTTVVPTVQKTMEEILQNDDYLPAESKKGLCFSMCIVEKETGNVVGIVGKSGKKEANRVLNLATTPHTPGSALKPIALYAALIDEGIINAATVFDDVPVEFIIKKNKTEPYPQNSTKIYAGLTTITDAIRFSKNTVALRLYQMRGAEKIYEDLVSKFGFDTIVRKKSRKDSSTMTDLAPAPLALGQLTYGVGLLNLTEAYNVFPSDGIWKKGRTFTKVVDAEGKILLCNEAESKRVYQIDTARIMNQLLCGVVNSGTAKSITLKNKIATAGKTGTSGDDKDRLFIGYTPYYTAGIWCGYENSDRAVSNVFPNHLSVWDDVMSKIHERLGLYQENHTFSNEGLVRVCYCKDSGERFCPTCALDPRNNRMAYGYFSYDNQPSENCKTHVLLRYDTITHALAGSGCPDDVCTDTALIRVENRSFPIPVTVTDAQYVYREMKENMPLSDSSDVPFFYYQIEDGVFVGKSPGSKPYNAFCYWHDDDEKSA